MTSYAEKTGHPPDFEVRYRFFTSEEGGRRTGPPFQHYRCDWSYDGDDVSKGIFMIWPEFLADDGSPLQEDAIVPGSGFATMWIVSDDMRGQVHRAKIQEGVKGYFMEGARKIAETVVTRILGLHSNSDSQHNKKSEPNLGGTVAKSAAPQA
jgi:hypothetical protein